MAGANSLIRNPYVLGGGAFVVMVAAVAGGYFLGQNGIKPNSDKTPAELAASRTVCEATLDRVRDYGIAEQTAQLTTVTPKDTDIKDRVVCTAKNGDTTYMITVNVKCDNMGDDKCLQLWNVTDSGGTTLFQHREFMPPDDE